MRAVGETWNLSAATLQAMWQMIIGTRASDELGGPLRIAQMSGEVAQGGIVADTWFMAVLSINLGLINLFPVPVLDGGHLLFYALPRRFAVNRWDRRRRSMASASAWPWC